MIAGFARENLPEAALRYAGMGCPVFPVRPGDKQPLTGRGFHDASDDPCQVAQWWRQWPDANIGLPVPEGLMVLDVDGEAGRASLAALEAQHAPLPATATVRTGRGEHLWLALADGANVRCSAGKFGNGLDVRAKGGYVLLPPSVHASGSRYKGTGDSRVADCPGWLLGLLGTEPPKTTAHEEGIIPEGQRHQHLLGMAGAMRRRGAGGRAIEAALLAENTARCHPPKPETEVRKLARDAAQWPADKPAGKGFTLTPLSALLAEPDEPEDWLWDGCMAAGTVSMVVAKPKVGKSTFARNLALAVSRGEDFLGRATKQGKVVYLALEEQASEVKADFQALGATGGEPIHVHAAPAPAEAIAELAALLREHRPRLLVIDPMVRLTRLKDEKAYAEVYGALGPLIDLARETGTHILLLHHSGKAMKTDAVDSPLGSTALGGAVGTLIVMRRANGSRTIQTVQRRGVDMAETILGYDSGSKRLSVSGTKADADMANAQSQILTLLLGGGNDHTEEQIMAETEGRTGVLRQALRVLVTEGRIARHGTGKKCDAFRYSLGTPPADSECSLSRSHAIAGTREREPENRTDTRMNPGQMLVSGLQPKPILAPANSEPGLPDANDRFWEQVIEIDWDAPMVRH